MKRTIEALLLISCIRPGFGQPAAPTPRFEVASVRVAEPGLRGAFEVRPGGVVVRGQPLGVLLKSAFRAINGDRVDAPQWVNTERFDIDAKTPKGSPPLTDGAANTMIRALLVDRFKMAYHTAQRPVKLYSLVATKPKIKKADAAGAARCLLGTVPPGAPAATIAWDCRNITMDRFASQLQTMAGGALDRPVTDGTGLEGGWDFSLVFVRDTAIYGVAGAAHPESAVGDSPDPVHGYTVREAIERQLGLKLETSEQALPVTVIDHLERRPTEN